jgi:low temperature requirement protein LtrA
VETVRTIGFAAAFVLARVSLLVLYGRAYRAVPATRRATRVIMAWYTFSALLWVGVTGPPTGWRYVAWALVLVVELVGPWFGWSELQQIPADAVHLPDRVGSFVLIALYVSMWALVQGLSDVRWQTASLAAALFAFAIVIMLWWLYFAYLDSAATGTRIKGGMPYVYAHLPIVLSLTFIGVGLELAIAGPARSEGGGHGAAVVSWELTAGLATWLVAFALVQRLTESDATRGGAPRRYLTAAVISLGVGALGRVLPSPVALGLLTAALLAVLVWDVRRWQDRNSVADSSPRSDSSRARTLRTARMPDASQSPGSHPS